MYRPEFVQIMQIMGIDFFFSTLYIELTFFSFIFFNFIFFLLSLCGEGYPAIEKLKFYFFWSGQCLHNVPCFPSRVDLGGKGRHC